MTPSSDRSDRSDVTDLERRVRDALEQEASRAPLGQHLADSVSTRVDRHGLPGRAQRLGSSSARRPLLLGVALLALALTVVGVALLFGRTGVALRPVGGGPSSAAATPVAPILSKVDLIGSGPCAGLTLRVERPGPATGATNELVTWVRPGAANLLTVDGNDLRYLHAEGPCVDRLSYDVVGIDGPAGLQGANGTSGQRFSADEGVGVLVSASTAAARERVVVRLACRDGDHCPDPRAPVASVFVSVVSPFLGDETTEPTSPPSVTQTYLVTSGPMTFTRRAVSPGATPGAGGAVATTTVTVSPAPPP